MNPICPRHGANVQNCDYTCVPVYPSEAPRTAGRRRLIAEVKAGKPSLADVNGDGMPDAALVEAAAVEDMAADEQGVVIFPCKHCGR